ncbi:MAG TPA: hypothetical protein VHL11_00260, partial [Phototrophicaceae bacterium]|nr:hypothetical protein [Phototrophicaceae bacterium]
MEQWLNQHIFKVGWLVTKNFQTTTILYYTFFLPGVILHEFTRWLVAGMLDVRAERAIGFPEKQEIGELKLNFIRLHKKAAFWKIPIINYAPPVVGLVVIYIIAVSILDVPAGLTLMQSGTLESIGNGIGYITSRPDFTLWAYIVFTVSNSTIPNNLVITGWRTLIITAVVVGVLLSAIGLADNVFGTIIPPVLNGLNSLSGLFLVMMAINVLFTAILSIIENSIEYITGDSATFKNGKLVAMRREEIIAMREQERQKTVKARQAAKQKPALPAGPPSVYRLPLPIPGGPGETPPVRVIQPDQPAALPERPARTEPTLIPGAATSVTGATTPSTPTVTTPAASIPAPGASSPGLVINPPRSDRFG